MIRSLYNASNQGALPINPAHYTGRYTLKWVYHISTYEQRINVMISNMLTISFAMRTDSTDDPLIQRILTMAMEFNDLTG